MKIYGVSNSMILVRQVQFLRDPIFDNMKNDNTYL